MRDVWEHMRGYEFEVMQSCAEKFLFERLRSRFQFPLPAAPAEPE
jgi:hypothetical protein